ncbi:mevalonate kinase [Fonticula alba]|uniref:Mevalonate kinase n=1 Tax=Fonticula alba TaxID=691883 RepID=A0A058ZB05_FONAL|nr:mevalonate kinase [Fonticula alba]KCV71579.1 mevalonate kinase [Fonticula alba]|eukprot:XP_009494702.1 mevalonate kinase [Fonticula alba]
MCAEPIYPEVVLSSAPGKVILSGEHAVVHFKTAIAVSVDLRTFVSIHVEPFAGLGEATIALDMPDVRLDSALLSCAKIAALGPGLPSDAEAACSPLEMTDHTREAFDAASKAFVENPASLSLASVDAKQSSTPLPQSALALTGFLFLVRHLLVDKLTELGLLANVSVHSTLPIGAGLGSSASYATALSAALLKWRVLLAAPDTPAKWFHSAAFRDLVNQWSFRAEQLIHGTPSGVDNFVSTFGGTVAFRRGEAPVSMPPLPAFLRFIVTNTRVPRSTRALVEKVASNLAEFPTVVGPVLDAIQGISDAYVELLAPLGPTGGADLDHPAMCAFLAKFAKLMTINNHLLSSVGVGHASIDRVADIAGSLGQCATKLTGAGGGGCVISLVPEPVAPDTQAQVAAVVDAVSTGLREAGFAPFETRLGGPGVLFYDLADDLPGAGPEDDPHALRSAMHAACSDHKFWVEIE